MIELDLQRSSPCGRVEPEVYAGRKISDLINLCYNNGRFGKGESVIMNESQLMNLRDLYLRGYSSKYLKKHYGMSIATLHKEWKSLSVDVSSADIIPYQIKYLESHYMIDEIVDAYRFISSKFPDLYKAGSRHEIFILDCCFGKYAKVFRSILGMDRFNQLKNDCWKKKQEKTVEARYGVKNVFEKRVFHDFVSDEAIENGRKKRIKTLIDRYGTAVPNSNPEIQARMLSNFKLSVLSKYGVDNPMRVRDIALKSARHRMIAMTDKYGQPNSVQIPEIRDKIMSSRIVHNQFVSSLPEDVMYSRLSELFGKDNVLRNYKSARYPYHVDFYVKSRDLFIEFNGDPSHGFHWFSDTNSDDMNRLSELSQLAVHSKRYKGMLRIWTETDVQKRNVARKNKLNYLVFWKYKVVYVNKKQTARLIDFDKWVSSGCPDSYDYYLENTY